MNFIIVIPVYSRPFCLKRLTECVVLSANYKSLNNKCKYHLCFSVDPHSDLNITKEILKIIDKVEWNLGEKKVIEHEKHLGLFKNILFCGSLSKNYDACIVLESDLILSPFCLDYIYESHQFFNQDSNIAGISLYSYQYSETNNGSFPFTPVNEGCDNYFLRFPSSWGQMWNYRQWSEFETWLDNNYEETFIDQRLPANVYKWSPQSWKKQFCRYLVDTSKYFVYPHISLTSNTGEVGVHYLKTSDKKKVPLLLGQKYWFFKSFKDINILYDQFFHPQVINYINENSVHVTYNFKSSYFLAEEKYLINSFVLAHNSNTTDVNDCSDNNTNLSSEKGITSHKQWKAIFPQEKGADYERELIDLFLARFSSKHLVSHLKQRFLSKLMIKLKEIIVTIKPFFHDK